MLRTGKADPVMKPRRGSASTSVSEIGLRAEMLVGQQQHRRPGAQEGDGGLEAAELTAKPHSSPERAQSVTKPHR